jgi:hypothetical protein
MRTPKMENGKEQAMRGYVASVVLAFVALCPAAFAADEPLDVDGELHVTCKNAEYVKVQVGGHAYDAIEFEKDGKVVVIKGLTLALERIDVTLVPRNEELEPTTLELDPKEFKRTRRGRVYFMVANKTVEFDKAPIDKQVEPEGEPEPAPVAPPAPKKDDL